MARREDLYRAHEMDFMRDCQPLRVATRGSGVFLRAADVDLFPHVAGHRLKREYSLLQNYVLSSVQRVQALHDVEYSIELLLEDKHFWELYLNYRALMTPDLWAQAAQQQPLPLDLGVENQRLSRTAQRLDAAAALASLQLLAQVAAWRVQGIVDDESCRPPRDRDDVLAMLSDARVPSVIRRLLHGVYVADIAATVCWSQEALPDWLAADLLGRWCGGRKFYLQVLASIPGIGVPEELIADSERIDLGAEIQKHAQYEATFRRRLDEATKSGATMFPALNEPIED